MTVAEGHGTPELEFGHLDDSTTFLFGDLLVDFGFLAENIQHAYFLVTIRRRRHGTKIANFTILDEKMSVDVDHVTAPHEWFLAGVPENFAIKIHASQSTLLASFAFMIAIFVGEEIDSIKGG